MGPLNPGSRRLFVTTADGQCVELGGITDVNIEPSETTTFDGGRRGDHIIHTSPSTATITLSPTDYTTPFFEDHNWGTGILSSVADNIISTYSGPRFVDIDRVDLSRVPDNVAEIASWYTRAVDDLADLEDARLNDTFADEELDTGALDEFLNSLNVQEG